MEKLLNKLIEKGWKPRGIKVKKILNLGEGKIIFIANGKENFSKLRFLTVKESNLWQYVCENALYSYTNCVWKGCEGPVVADYIEPQSYQYRLIESALKDESELEEFLLNSIIIDD